MSTYIVLDFTLHANNVFSIYFVPSIVKLCTDHILASTIISVCLVLMLYVSPVVCLTIHYGTCVFYMCIV